MIEENCLTGKLCSLLEGGIDILQFRAKGRPTEWCTRILDELFPYIESACIPFIINDDVELALRYPGAGLHIGQDDGCAKEARDKLGDGRLLGLSTHSPDQARAAIELKGTIDYFAVGPVFQTATKPEYESVGTELVSTVAEMNPPIPFFAIGGIGRKNATQVLEAGANGLVVISDVLCDADSKSAAMALKALYKQQSPEASA